VQNRYAGDAGDFMTFGLLRSLSGRDAALRLGVNWYLRSDEAHNADGRHVSYLRPSSAHHRSLSRCDPDLMVRLARVVSGIRSVAALEAAGVVPADTLVFNEPVPTSGRLGDRKSWHRRALDALLPADLVFVAPDNGLRLLPRGRAASKYASYEEVAAYVARDQSLVVYQHADRSPGRVESQVDRRCGALAEATGRDPIGAVVTRRGSCRYFVLLAAPAHRDLLRERAAAHCATWAPHAAFAVYDKWGESRRGSPYEQPLVVPHVVQT